MLKYLILFVILIASRLASEINIKNQSGDNIFLSQITGYEINGLPGFTHDNEYAILQNKKVSSGKFLERPQASRNNGADGGSIYLTDITRNQYDFGLTFYQKALQKYNLPLSPALSLNQYILFSE